ncbi:N-acetylmuramoyl-L-alanine amidase [Terasakiella pusilla]|uniref:N-acetylmuramoyl-L-alanine amidase n=1 Tax=Terasakiella pusilla TaxID=64973 RepID=UPI00048CB179|nr:N-acetylmuramoyl-L-alanine amidase [Terasakiella pusilla]
MTLDILPAPSPNFNNRPDGCAIDMLVLHYTGMQSGPEALDRMCDEAAQVSAHYMVEEDGTIFQLVAEEKRAWHGGVSHWRGDSNINDRSIGIEIVNPGHEWGYRPFPDAQINRVVQLCQAILSRHPHIPPRNVIGHSDIAPARKQDPGELFPWQHLAAHGIGLWPTDLSTATNEGEIDRLLSDFGYDPQEPQASLIAFYRHFQPDALQTPDLEKSRAILRALLDLATK